MNLTIATTKWFLHLFLPKDYSGSPSSSIYTPWTDKEAKAYLTTGWGEGAITELKLEYLYGPETEVSGGGNTVDVAKCYKSYRILLQYIGNRIFSSKSRMIRVLNKILILIIYLILSVLYTSSG
jgi:hypothetical protein